MPRTWCPTHRGRSFRCVTGPSGGLLVVRCRAHLVSPRAVDRCTTGDPGGSHCPPWTTVIGPAVPIRFRRVQGGPVLALSSLLKARIPHVGPWAPFAGAPCRPGRRRGLLGAWCTDPRRSSSMSAVATGCRHVAPRPTDVRACGMNFSHGVAPLRGVRGSEDGCSSFRPDRPPPSVVAAAAVTVTGKPDVEPTRVISTTVDAYSPRGGACSCRTGAQSPHGCGEGCRCRDPVKSPPNTRDPRCVPAAPTRPRRGRSGGRGDGSA